MITRLKVNYFKNLVDSDISFGPFTCIAGQNGAGKSNLFDAIRFLSMVASKTLTEAALSVRDESRSSDVRSIFHRVGESYAEQMSFEVEMFVPSEEVDDLGQAARATNTFLRYKLDIGWRKDPKSGSYILELNKEELAHFTAREASKHLGFEHSATKWRDSILKAKAGRGAPFISTTIGKNGELLIRLHQDGKSGNPLLRAAKNLPRTMLSAANAAESPTVLCARREMESWTLLQLEPSALRRPDDFSAVARVGHDGAHLPATLYRLAQHEKDVGQVYSQVANRLSELIKDVRSVGVDRDEKRESLTLTMTGRDGTEHPARALSDGTLRFLALAIIEIDPEATGVICLEEPENGIHPERIPAMLRLLQDIATDASERVDATNPLRQIILNTHSPLVVAEVPEDSLLYVDNVNALRDGVAYNKADFVCLPDTWRNKSGACKRTISKGSLLAYLQPATGLYPVVIAENKAPQKRRVIDREDMQILLELKVADENGSSVYASS